AGTIFVTSLTGMNSQFELNLVMTVLLGLVLVYTILGGMVAVVITDYFQFVVLSFGMLAACAFAVNELGWSNIVNTVVEEQGQAGFNPFHGEGFGSGYVVWMIFLGLVSCAVWQTAVMRACSAVDVQTVKRVYAWSSIGFLIRFLIPNFIGICAFVYFARDDALRAVYLAEDAESTTTLAAMPVFLSQVLPVGVIGIIAAGLLAAFMSTHDSYLLCWSSVLTQDVVAPLMGDNLSTRARLLITRCLIAAIGVFLLVWSLWYPLEQDMWDYMAITGAVYFTGAFALLLFGIYWKRASRTGAYLALSCGFVAIFGLKSVQDALSFSIPVEFVGLATVGLCIFSMVIGSLVFPDTETDATTQTGSHA
ncbi:MAG: hypothetical protein O7F76_02305, partial [Planctomycetota bacterium]|nr:hypothetical protein [Planctomycetota bacterium]